MGCITHGGDLLMTLYTICLARLSAPGYMDCTDWTVFKMREDAEEFLRNEYDVEEEETEEE